jgi:molybdopterin-containing oxidoreductase family membrane subunit
MSESPQLTYGEIDRTVLDTLRPPTGGYWLVIMVLIMGVLLGAACWVYQIFVGIGAGGHNIPVAWGTYLINFVFWVGIAHSGTLISAILYLMLPYPNQRYLWPNFQSPLVFDVVAISTYLTVSSLFWYTGMIPDLAAVRDRATGVRKKIFTILSLGWTGKHEQWRHYTRGYLFFAALATPLVVSVHSVVSWDFALSVVPGWHSTIFAPYFVAGAIHSGLAMVLTLMIPLRKIFRYERILTMKILEAVAKTIIFTGLIVGYAYAVEYFLAWYSHNTVEMEAFRWRALGDYSIEFWIMVVCNSVVPLLFFFKKIRTSIPWLLGISILINVGMWYERFVIIIGSVAHGFIPHAWGLYRPSGIEFGIMIGSFSLFLLLFLLFVKHLPSISMTEMKETLDHGESHGD